MTMLRLAGVVLALAALSACGAATPKPFDTPNQVASLIRAKWGATKGSPFFHYSCRMLDDRGRLFTCIAQDQNRLVRLARFDVTCDATRCTWMDYPAYIG
ncbi:MAG TPA: hypothetical protein VFJ93_06385 [Gaiellaceae bacterium]|nr:hypothetical protein [Gaiellaceae bacterium]